jgi:hypothetical protein
MSDKKLSVPIYRPLYGDGEKEHEENIRLTRISNRIRKKERERDMLYWIVREEAEVELKLEEDSRSREKKKTIIIDLVLSGILIMLIYYWLR